MSILVGPPPNWGDSSESRWAIISALAIQFSEGVVWVERDKLFVLSGLQQWQIYSLSVSLLLRQGWLLQKDFNNKPSISLDFSALAELYVRICPSQSCYYH